MSAINTTDTIDYGTLCDYRTGEQIRPATLAELTASMSAAHHDGGAGVIELDGRSCYVDGGDRETSDLLRLTAERRASQLSLKSILAAHARLADR